MTRALFLLLAPMEQLRHVLTFGTFLAQRQDIVVGGVNLYHLPGEGRGFFAEVCIDEAQDRFIVLRSFVGSGPLEDYTHGVQLPRN